METATSSAYNGTEDALRKIGSIPMVALVTGLTAAAGSILANLLTIAAIISSRLNKHSTHILVANQSGCDLVVAVNTIASCIRALYSHLLPLLVSNVLRLANSATIHCVVIISLGNSLLIGFDRFIATLRPFEYKSIVKNRRVYKSIALMWIIVISIIVIPMTIHNKNRNLNTWIVDILDLTVIYPPGFPAFGGIFVSTLMAMNFILYSVILVTFVKVRSRVEASNESGKKSRKLTSTVAIVVMFTLLCYSPFVVSVMLPPTPGEADVVKRMIPQVAFVMITFSSCMNNIIYPCGNRITEKLTWRCLDAKCSHPK